MLVIFGRRFARIGKYIDHDHICYPCKSFEREIRVYRSYFHLCYIPVFPMGEKQFEILRSEYVGNPVVGDIYTISEERNNGTVYYFLKICGVERDSVRAFHSNLEYNYFVNNLSGDDYFVNDDTMVYRRKQFKDMLEKGEIYMVKRNK